MPQASDQPYGVAGVLEREERLAQLLESVEGLHPQEVVLQRADEALGAAVVLGSRTKAGELVAPK